MKVFLLAMLSALLFSSCSVKASNAEENPKSVIDVYYSNEIRNYPAIKVLEDGFSIDGADIALHVIESGASFDEMISFGINGIVITDDPAFLYPAMGNASFMTVPKNTEADDLIYGSMNGSQYGYVFSNQISMKPVVLINKKAFEAAGIINEEYSPDSFKAIMEKLSNDFRIPLAVYGNPNDPSFCILQNLFKITSSGGAEFSFGDYGIVYDKVSERAKDYLDFLKMLYSGSYVATDMLVMSEYSAMRMMTSHISAIGVFTDNDYLESTISRMRESGIDCAYVTLPVSDYLLEYGLDRQLTGFVSVGCDRDIALKFLGELDKRSSIITTDDVLEDLEEYPLFVENGDLDDECTVRIPSSYLLFIKEKLENNVLEPYWSRFVVSDDQMSSFDSFVEQWMDSLAVNYESINGKTFLQLFEAVSGSVKK